MTIRLAVIGVGNAYRSDDAAGLEVVRRLSPVDGVRLIEHEGHGAGLLDVWHGAAAAIVIDAASSGAAPGTIQRFDAAAGPLPARLFVSSSSHSFGVSEAIELGRSLARLPASLTTYAIEGANFEAGTEMSPEVDAAVNSLVAELRPRLRGRSGRPHTGSSSRSKSST